MADEQIAFTLTVTGEDKVATALGNVAGQAGRVEDTTKKLSGTVATAGEKWGQFGSAIGLAGRAIAGQNQALGALVGTMGQSVSMIGTLRNSMGNLGAAVGVAAAAFSVFEQAQAAGIARIDELRRAADAAVPSLRSLIAAFEDQARAQELANRVASGQGSVAEQRGYAAQMTGQRAMLEAIANGTASEAQRQAFQERYGEVGERQSAASALWNQVTGSEGHQLTGADRARARQMLGSARAGEAAASGFVSGRVIEMEAQDIGGSTRRRGGRGGGGASRRPDSSWMDAGVAGKRADQAAAAAAEEAAAAEVERENRRMQGLYELAQREAEARDELREGQREKERQAHEDRLSELEEWGAAGERVGAALYDAFELVASGQATLAQAAAQLFKQSLQQFAKSEMLEAGKEIGLALGSLAMENYPGAAKHFASAAQHGLVAAAAGVGAIAIGSATSGGGAGAGRGNARPEAAGRSGGGSGSAIVINWNAPTITAGTHAELGREIIRAQRVATRAYGIAA